MSVLSQISISSEIDSSFITKDETLLLEKVSDEKRRIEIEIGDIKEPTKFLPQFKTKHWDNESNMSVRLVDDDIDNGVVATEANKISWSRNGRTVRFYEKDDGFEDGGFEVEVELDIKPETNVLMFSLQTKNLDFFYQPKLTSEEISSGDTRPENVEGSYAVYHKTMKNDFSNRHYRTGKAFHIYRPWAEDSLGNRVWCELYIDEVTEKLSIIIPQNFLDTAQYPVIVDPTFGYTSQGASYESGDGEAFGHVITGIDGDINTISAWVRESESSELTAPQQFYIHDNPTDVYSNIVYSDTEAVSLTINTATLIDHTLSSPLSIISGDTHYFVALSEYRGPVLGQRSIYYDTGTGTTGGLTYINWIAVTTKNYSVYVTYADTALFTRGFIASLPTDKSNLATSYSTSDETDVATDNNIYVDLEGVDLGYMIHQYKYEHTNNTDNPTATWRGKSNHEPSTSTVYLQIWNNNTSAWEALDSDAVTGAGVEFELTGTKTATVANYYDGASNEVAVRVYQQKS